MSYGADPVRDASVKVMTWMSMASVAAEAMLQISQMRAKARSDEHRKVALAARAALDARFQQDRMWWQPMLNSDQYAVSTVREAGMAWMSAQSWRGYPEAEQTTRLAESRLQALRPDVMEIFRHYVDNNVDPVVAMGRVGNLLSRPPADANVDRMEYVMPHTAAEKAAATFAEEPPRVQFDASERGILSRALKDAERFYDSRMDASWVPGYLAQRGFEAGQGEWKVGYAPGGPKEWTTLVDHMKGLGYKDQELVDAGLASWSKRNTLVDRFRDRMMFSVHSATGELVSFVGRKNPENIRVQDLKWLNGPGTRLYHKGEHLLGAWENRRELRAGGLPVVTEGCLDAWAVTEASGGKFVGVSPSGTALTPGQVEALKTVSDVAMTGVAVAFDNDNGGREGTLRAGNVLREAGLDMPLVVDLPTGKDPADLWKADAQDVGSGGGQGTLAVALSDAHPLADRIVDERIEGSSWPHEMDSPEVRSRAVHASAAAIADLPEPARPRQIVRVSERLGMDRAVVEDCLIDALVLKQQREATHQQHGMSPHDRAVGRQLHATQQNDLTASK